MAYQFNPFTGNFDNVGSSSGGSVIAGHGITVTGSTVSLTTPVSAGDIPTLNQNTSGTAAIATTETITDDTTTSATMYVSWYTSNSGNLPAKVSSTKLSFNPSTGTLTATAFVGDGSGLTNLPAGLSQAQVLTRVLGA